MTDHTLTERVRNINGKNLGISLVLAFIPTVGLAVELSIGVPIETPLLFWAPLAGFTYLLYRHTTTRNKGGSVLYYLSIEFFLLPVAMLFFLLMRTGETNPTGTELLGDLLTEGLFLLGAIIIGLCGGIALYLISKRVFVDSPSETGASG